MAMNDETFLCLKYFLQKMNIKIPLDVNQIYTHTKVYMDHMINIPANMHYSL